MSAIVVAREWLAVRPLTLFRYCTEPLELCLDNKSVTAVGWPYSEAEALPFHPCQYQRGLQLEDRRALDTFSYNVPTARVILSRIYVLEMQNGTKPLASQ
jgi:hypothetical protein